ncbi:hypothetical protein LZ554_006035 [Drepanopeziza brunnea f. sp. 'monogermtubi']|nr:hypothetical protein LZ554_006035 [Drepanopeziza brunnea f. sp. 'monogermtubi']
MSRPTQEPLVQDEELMASLPVPRIVQAPEDNLSEQSKPVEEEELAGEEGSTSPATVTEEASEVLEESPLTSAKKPTKKLCGVCNTNEPKYKCSRCYLPNCSVKCSTLHKATHPAEETRPASLPPKPEPQVKTGAARAGTVGGATNSNQKGPFSALDNSKELQALFKRHPRLPGLLEKINKATLPPTNTNGHQNHNGRKRKDLPWNSERGLQKGIQELNDLRNTGSTDGKADPFAISCHITELTASVAVPWKFCIGKEREKRIRTAAIEYFFSLNHPPY